MRPLRIASRRSPLALAQSELVRHALASAGFEVEQELATFETEGDRRLGMPLAEIGGKGLFTQELEHALRGRTADIAVHSLKDLPTDMPDGLIVAGALPREDPRDALISRSGLRLGELPPGSRIGTSSPRRRAQIGLARPDLEVVDMRGNVGTRLRRLEEGVVDALVMAHAGLIRAGLSDRVTEVLDPQLMLPAPAQGIIALEVLGENGEARAAAKSVSDAATLRLAAAERALLRALGGGCAVPVGAHAVEEGGIRLSAGVFRPDGGFAIRDGATGQEPEALGRMLAERLLAAGADRLLERAQ